MEKRNPSKSWFEMRKDFLIPLIQDKHHLVKDYYSLSGSEETKDLLFQAREWVEAAVKDTQVRWLDIKVEALDGYQFDPKIAWAVMRDIFRMLDGHIKSKTIIKMMKPDGTMAKNNA